MPKIIRIFNFFVFSAILLSFVFFQFQVSIFDKIKMCLFCVWHRVRNDFPLPIWPMKIPGWKSYFGRGNIHRMNRPDNAQKNSNKFVNKGASPTLRHRLVSYGMTHTNSDTPPTLFGRSISKFMQKKQKCKKGQKMHVQFLF